MASQAHRITVAVLEDAVRRAAEQLGQRVGDAQCGHFVKKSGKSHGAIGTLEEARRFDAAQAAATTTVVTPYTRELPGLARAALSTLDPDGTDTGANQLGPDREVASGC